MTDAALIERFVQGETQAFNTLVWRWEKPLFNFILRNIGNHETAKDLTQTAFIRMYKELKRLREPEKFSPWMYRIALNLCKDEYKRNKNKVFYSIDESSDSMHAMPVTDTESRSPEDLCHDRHIGEILKRSLLSLPEEQRIVIIMKQYQGLKFEEIAEILSQPVNTIKSRLYYGLRALRKILEESKLNKEVLLNEM